MRSAFQRQRKSIAQVAPEYEGSERAYADRNPLTPEDLQLLVDESDILSARLDVLCRFVLIMHGIAKESKEAVAAQLGVSPGAVACAYSVASADARKPRYLFSSQRSLKIGAHDPIHTANARVAHEFPKVWLFLQFTKSPQSFYSDIQTNLVAILETVGYRLCSCKQRLGHSGSSVTDNYTHTFTDDERNAAEKLGELFGTGWPEIDAGKVISFPNLSQKEEGPVGSIQQAL